MGTGELMTEKIIEGPRDNDYDGQRCWDYSDPLAGNPGPEVVYYTDGEEDEYYSGPAAAIHANLVAESARTDALVDWVADDPEFVFNLFLYKGVSFDKLMQILDMPSEDLSKLLREGAGFALRDESYECISSWPGWSTTGVPSNSVW